MSRFKRSFGDYLALYFKGLAMGSANKVPGVSGGMIALVLDFYEELIYSFQKINGKALTLLRKKGINKFAEYINFKFLFIVNIGSISAYFSVSLLLDWLMKSAERGGLGATFEVWAYFFGMIIGSVYYVYKRIETAWNWQNLIGVLAGTGLGLYLSFLEPFAPNQNLWFVFFCGVISVSGMTLPGFSGSFMLIILGNYNLLLVDGVNNLLHVILQSASGNADQLTHENWKLFKIVMIFGIGSVFGLISFSRVMGFLLRNYRDLVLIALMGFIAGSLGAAWPWKNELVSNNGELLGYERFIPTFSFRFVIQIICVLFGVVTIVLIDYFEHRKIKSIS